MVAIICMYPSMLRWTLGVLYVELADRSLVLVCCISLFCFCLFLFTLEFAIVDGVAGAAGVGYCQNDSIVGYFDGRGVPLAVGLVQIVQALSALFVSLLLHVLSITTRLPPPASWKIL